MFLLKSVILFISASYIVAKNVGIIGGHYISIEKVPFIASLRLNGTVHWCGSSIIHERFVLTAAHCILANEKYKVLVGTDKSNQGGTLYDVEKILVHEKYSNSTSDYDICIIKLNETLTFGPKVKVISLIDASAKLVDGMWFNATGWGATQLNGRSSKNLRQVKIPFISFFKCQKAYLPLKITSRMVCAGGNGRDVCSGDSGGPLTWQDVQIGITSFGVRCGGLPAVYTMISALRPWIDHTIKQNL